MATSGSVAEERGPTLESVARARFSTSESAVAIRLAIAEAMQGMRLPEIQYSFQSIQHSLNLQTAYRRNPSVRAAHRAEIKAHLSFMYTAYAFAVAIVHRDAIIAGAPTTDDAAVQCVWHCQYQAACLANVDAHRNKQNAFEAWQTAAAALRFAIVMVAIQAVPRRDPADPRDPEDVAAEAEDAEAEDAEDTEAEDAEAEDAEAEAEAEDAEAEDAAAEDAAAEDAAES
jgi:hypothetical protein